MNTRTFINSLITLLLVEDNPGDAALLQRTLPKGQTTVTHVARLQQAIQLLGEKRFDVILLDLSLPDSAGLETLNHLNPNTTDTPVVVLTGSDDDALALQAVQHGAQDYIVKGQMSGAIIMRLLRYAIERKRAELELKASEKRFRALIENSADLIIVIDAEGVIRFVSPSAERLLGYSPVEAIGRNFLEWVHPDDMPIALESLASRREIPGTAQARVELRSLHKNGLWRTVEVLGTNLLAEPAVNGIVLNVRDITERKQAEEKLVKLQKAVDNSGEVIFMTDPDGLITFVNPEFTHLYGYTAAEVIGKTTPRILKSERVKPEDYDLLWQTILGKQVVRGEMVNKTKEGRLLTIETSINPVLDDKGNIAGFLAIQSDITERRQAAEKLAASEAELRALFAAMHDVVLTIDADGVYRKIAPTNPDLLFKPPQELLGKSLTDVFPPREADQFLSVTREVVATQQSKQIEYQLRIGETLHWFSTSGVFDK